MSEIRSHQNNNIIVVRHNDGSTEKNWISINIRDQVVEDGLDNEDKVWIKKGLGQISEIVNKGDLSIHKVLEQLAPNSTNNLKMMRAKITDLLFYVLYPNFNEEDFDY